MAWNVYTGDNVGGSYRFSSIIESENSYDARNITLSNNTAIIEFGLIQENICSGVGLHTSIPDVYNQTNIEDSFSWIKSNNIYSFSTQQSNVKCVVTQDHHRRVFALHRISNTTVKNITTKIFVKLYSKSEAYFGYTSASSSNSWVSFTSGSGNKYYSITATEDNIFTGTTLSVIAGHTYTFNLHTYSESSCDGIIISSTSLSSSATVTSSGFTRCSGINNTVTYSYTPLSNGTVYIYFKTDSSVLGEQTEHTGYDASGNYYSYTTEDGYTYGDVEVIDTPPTTMDLTLNRNGGSGGSSTVTATTGQNLPSITVPTRTGFVFLGYYNTSSTSGGTLFINSSGTGITVWDDSTNTLYARWRPTYTYNIDGAGLTDMTMSGHMGLDIYCTNRHKACANTDSSKIIQISRNGVIVPSGVSYYFTLAVYDDDDQYQPKWRISPDGKRLYAPKDTPSGRYYAEIDIYIYSGSNYTYVNAYLGTVEIGINSVSLYCLDIQTIGEINGTRSIRIGQSTLFDVGARYSNSANLEISNRSDILYSMDPNNIIDIYYDYNYRGSRSGLKMYIDKFDEDSYHEDDFQNFILYYYGSDCYEYVNQTIQYNGSVYYLWEQINHTNRNSCVQFILTDTINLNVLYAHSLKYSLNNIHTYPIIVKLDSDCLEYRDCSDICIVDVWDDNNPNWDFYYETGISDEGWQEPYEPYEPYEPPEPYDPNDDPDEPWDDPWDY